MAVQIVNFMPDAEVHRGEPASPSQPIRESESLRRNDERKTRFITGRAVFVAITVGIHVVAALAFLQMSHRDRPRDEPAPIMATMLESPQQQTEKPPEYVPPVDVVYELPIPQEVTFESESIVTPVAPVTTAIAPTTSQVITPPMVESVEYIRQPLPVYPNESKRRRERGTVLLRVLVDSHGRPAQIQIERSSGYERLDNAAREAVQNALFRPYEMNGTAQPAQVLIPIEFARRPT